MKLSRNLRLLICALALLAVLHPEAAQACSSCFGKSDSRLAVGMNAGIFALLGVVGMVLAGIASFFVFIVKREAAVQSGADDESQSLNEKV